MTMGEERIKLNVNTISKQNSYYIMKILQKLSLLPAVIAVLSAVSCVNEPLSGEGQEADGPIASVEQQIVYVKSSASLISSVQTGIDKMVEEIENDALAASLETLYDEFTNRGDALEDHIGFLRNGASWLEATMATLEQQKALAYVNGALYAAVDKEELKAAFESHLKAPLAELAESADKWIGASYETYYSVAQTAGTLEYLLTLAGRQLEDDKGGLEGLLSDVEAGLRDGAEPSEFKALISVVDGNASALEQLLATVQSVVAELEAEYAKAFEAALSGSGDYSAKTLKKANTKASAELQDATTSLNSLVARIETCEAEIETLKARVGKLEADVEELLGMIQSVTFMSQYSEEYALAYYSMEDTKVSAPGKPYDGKNKRTPVNNIELNYMVRPAAAASAVKKDVVSVVGYYADQIQTKSIDPTRFVNFAVTDVSVNAERGIVTVTVSHDLKDDFYYRQTGAKCALFVATGKTDISSKFVELYPKDNSTTVYVESIKIDQDDFEIDEGQTKNLTATVNPSSATNKTIKWTSLNTEIATIDQYSGVLTAVKQGNVTITATTNDINDWGDNLTASVNVKVNPSIRLGGPLYVEVGKTAELTLSFPPEMNIEEGKVWMSSDETKATVNEDGVVTGVAHNYNEFTFVYEPKVVISCIINGNITLTHEMEVIVPQPTGIRFNDYADDVTSVDIKLYQQISLAGTLIPSESNADYFTAEYFTIKYLASKDGSAVMGFVDFTSGSIAPGSTGTWTVTATVDDNNDKDNRLKKSVKRSMVINVEPYYVETMTLPATFEMNTQQTATLSATFTSDVEGNQPTYRNLRWTSSDPTVVSVNETTGEMTSYKEGTVTITATTTHANAVPSGQPQKSASCIVTVKTPVAPIAIGDYFYSDGTWSTERDNSKTVIGIVFATVNATGTDTHLRADYPKCTNGLVVSTVEYTSAMIANRLWGRADCTNWWDNNGYNTYGNTSQLVGYANTKAHEAINAANIQSYGYTIDWTLFNASSPLATHKTQVPTPKGVSSWYVPSYAEMGLIKANIDKVNSALSGISGGNTINTSGDYWCSSHRDFYSGWYNAFSMSNNGWTSSSTSYSTVLPFRVILAF